MDVPLILQCSNCNQNGFDGFEGICQVFPLEGISFTNCQYLELQKHWNLCTSTVHSECEYCHLWLPKHELKVINYICNWIIFFIKMIKKFRNMFWFSTWCSQKAAVLAAKPSIWWEVRRPILKMWFRYRNEIGFICIEIFFMDQLVHDGSPMLHDKKSFRSLFDTSCPWV